MPETQTTAVYIRRSTDNQRDEHQRIALDEWLSERGLRIGEVNIYGDAGSGADPNREEFQELLGAIKDDEYDDVVAWEISRIGRRGSIIQEFFDACEDHGVTVHITSGKVDRIKPDGTNRFVADIVGMVYTEERRQLIRRTKAGQQRARGEGKWLGQVPVGFVRSDGYLRPNFDPDYDAGETGFLDIVDALERIDSGMSYRKAAQNTPNTTRQTLSKIDQDEERRSWYLDGEPEDDRVAEAVSEVS